ncbi:hypothetical protein ACU8KH_01794 [Lachancea thermotolerans]
MSSNTESSSKGAEKLALGCLFVYQASPSLIVQVYFFISTIVRHE